MISRQTNMFPVKEHLLKCDTLIIELIIVDCLQDRQYYPATVTAIGPTTAVVVFDAFGNFEEVLFGDLRPRHK